MPHDFTSWSLTLLRFKTTEELEDAYYAEAKVLEGFLEQNEFEHPVEKINDLLTDWEFRNGSSVGVIKVGVSSFSRDDQIGGVKIAKKIPPKSASPA